MDSITHILARILGFYFLAIGLGFLLNPKRLKEIYHQVTRNDNFLFLGSIIALLFGATIVSLHNWWMWGWPLIITLIGWWSLIKGFALFTYPESIRWFSFLQNPTTTTNLILAAIYIILGIFFLYAGFSGLSLFA